MFCRSCGNQLKDSARFCASCGSAVVSTEPTVGLPPDAQQTAEIGSAATPAASYRGPDIGGVPARPLAADHAPVRSANKPLRWTLGIVAAVLILGGAAVFVLYRGGFFDSSQSSTAVASDKIAAKRNDTGSVKAEDTTANTERPSGTPSDITASNSSVVGSHTKSGYPTSNLTDVPLDTAWAEGVSGYGEGETITFTYPSDVWVQGIRVVPGYKKYDAKNSLDRWFSNGRVSTAQMVFSDGSKSEVFTLDTDKQDWQEMMMDQPVKTSWVRFVIMSTAPANTGTVRDAEDTSISGMRILGFGQ